MKSQIRKVSSEFLESVNNLFNQCFNRNANAKLGMFASSPTKPSVHYEENGMIDIKSEGSV